MASDRRVTFSWTAPSCPGLDYYTFRVANHQDIDNGPWIIDHSVGSGETSVIEPIPSQYDNQTLYWAIWPHNSAGYGSRGGPWSFKVNPNQGSSDPVTIYSEANYQPQDHDNYGWHDPCTSPECGNLPNWLNTRASSIKIDPGWSVRLYEGDGQTGGQRCYNDSDDNFDDDTFDNGHSVNDHVRSVAVYHQEQCPSLPQPPPAPSLSTPGNGTSYPQSTSITLDWHPSSGATEYLARLSNTSGYVVYSNWIAATEWSVGQLSPGTYNWQVRARNQYGESPYSSEWTFIIQQGAPNAPSNLNASAVSQSQINLTWADNSSNETGFRLFREGLHVATLGAGTTTYQDTGLECGRGYNYYIVAYNDAGESGHSNTASATTQACPPTAPPAPNPVSPAQDTTFNCGDEITLVWDDLGAGVEYYAETWGANTRNSGWQTGDSWYLGEQDDYQTSWHVKARYVGETAESGWGSTTWFNANNCPQYPDLRPYTPSGYQYPVVPSMVQGTHSESTLYTGQATYFDWHFINDGNATAMDDFHVELWVDSDRVLRYPYSEVGTGWLQGFDDWAQTVSTPGWHTVRLATDPDGTVSESDETNNEWTRDFYWHVPCNDLNENNDDPSSATWLACRDTATGDICPVGEYDYYYLYGSAGDTIIADIDAQVIGSELDSVLTLFDTDGTTVLVENDDYDGLDSRIMYTLSHDGYHFLRVREYGDNDGGGDHFYQLSLSGGVTAPYYDDLEGSLFNWSFHGMWHHVDENSPYPGAHSGTHSMWYGQDTTGDYDDGTANSGSLTAPEVYIPDTGYYLRFNYWYETETQGLDYDRRCVQVSVDGGPYYDLHCLSDDGMGYWHHSSAIDLSDFVDHIIRIRFHFNTVDEYYNNFRGWYIDDFDISNTAPPSCSDGNEPNNSYATATTITYGGTESGYICPGGDLDYFAFTGNAGDTIIADVNADIYGSWLDSVLVLLASDGVTELASNDDAEPGSLDSLLGYTLPGDGTYYLKVRDYNHPSYGNSDYYYDLSLSVDNSAPTGAFLAPTTSTYISSTGHISIIAETSDVGSGVRNVTFLWHSGDWSDPDWEVLGDDWDGSDGWAIDWNVGSLPDQRDAALYAWAFDWAGNWVGMECWDLTLDREPPTTEMGVYAPYGGANFLDFWLDWYGDDPTAGVASYDIQYRDGLTGTWMDLVTDTADTYAHLVGADGHTYYFRSRARDWAGNAGEYPGTAQISYTVQVCPVDMDAWEIDDTVAESNPISTDGTAQTHNFDIPGDQDWVEFDAVEGQQYTFQTENVGGYADTVLHVYDTDGSTLLDFNDDFEGLGWASRVDWTAPADGTYYVMVKHWDEHAYGCETVYTLSSGVHPISEEYRVFLPLALRNR
ncbi:MAG: pre-peptidase C-terminal domain-containing protein [Chloroflexota bacterium]|nr:pre-peptidase C-terminal domain-containing protein [Chloroflexota bacterium]